MVKRPVVKFGGDPITPSPNFAPVFTLIAVQGGHKPGILGDFSEHGKLREFSATSGKNCNKQNVFSSSFKYLCKVRW